MELSSCTEWLASYTKTKNWNLVDGEYALKLVGHASMGCDMSSAIENYDLSKLSLWREGYLEVSAEIRWRSKR